MAIETALPTGLHQIIINPVTDCSVRFSDDPDRPVVLTASMRSGLGLPIFPPPAGATSVAVQMDSQVAMKLYEQLGELGRSMGWLPPIEGAPQA
jgi:hypothetical protein